MSPEAERPLFWTRARELASVPADPRRCDRRHLARRHPGHELVRVYEARLADASLYERHVWSLEIEDGSTCPVLWKRLDDFRIDRLYPDGLLELISRN
jgi:hypothetical protein